MATIQQISVFMENRKGSLSEITQLLAKSGVNLRALSIAETADYGVLRLIANDAEKASAALKEHGFVLSLNPVTVIAVPDEPAGLSEVLGILADGGVDIQYMYSLFTHQNGKAYMVFRISDEEEFIKVVTAHNMTLATAEELGLK
ncbi:MAG: ACT domain-containing protein [Clostridia bacterium]|nr:ACT domain-containing protein [Clostridia bacterium]